MKTKFIIGAALALIAASCTREEMPAEQESAGALAVTASVELPETKTSLSGLQVTWTVGDEIVIYDLNGKSCIFRAKTNAVNTAFEYVSGDTDLTGDVYAYYPANKVTGFDKSTYKFTVDIPSIQPYLSTGFADGINAMTAKATVENGSLNLQFKNLLSYVKVQIADETGTDKVMTDFSLKSSSKSLCGTAEVTVGKSGVATTSFTAGVDSVKISGVNASLSSTAYPVYVAVPAGDLGNLTISTHTSESTGYYLRTKGSTSTLTTERSSIYVYNQMNINNFERTFISLPDANCYMVAPGTTSLVIPLSQAVEGWEAIGDLDGTDYDMDDNITSGNRTISVRWLETTVGASINLVSINSDNMTLSLSGCPTGGNAIVDLKASDGTIVWSWHLWFTNYNPGASSATYGKVYTYNAPVFSGLYEGKVMMDRDLGATFTVESSTDTIAPPADEAAALTLFGLYYQYGRKDPFTEPITSTTSKSSDVNYAYAAKNPSKFIQTSTIYQSWSSSDDGGIKYPWGQYSRDAKSVLDPCPSGWRIPYNSNVNVSGTYTPVDTTNVYYDATDDIEWINNKKINATAGFQLCGSWFPSTSMIRPAACSSTGYIYKGAGYWSVSAIATTRTCACTIYFDIFGESYKAENQYRAYGYSIRCIKE